ncbi:MAG: hypothetical protein COW88_00685 [Candidatus Lloydbacteria bacterium CG22_combo_CG10-13_8_21_14_all_47_15]|uniref:Excinuclease ABC subunit C n=1 Tax=Candidatus Lloydbacteria bacterium CG22_combo_CG10-13_8_21_14_all_47_15 TaxID=1974635 RepID=A0A2H0CVD8_9BACT|nr:MAG: hypothetical protein COW88_00685 [Candidatus Lloydbacteria bacterium CG22_combo_CG10-13_8_21_14_all_47_15]
MEICQILKQKKLLDTPGVYRFLGLRGKVLYIGKATSLKNRIRSYCTGDISATRGPVIMEMLSRAKNIRMEQTDSVLEALVLEAALIKKFQPPFNAKEKSDKSFQYVVMTDETYPRVLIVRERSLFQDTEIAGTIAGTSIMYAFGPFPQGGMLREAMKIVRRIFPYRDTCKPDRGRPCFNSQIGLCPGVCTGAVSARAYAQTIHNIALFFEGKKKRLLKKLEREMNSAARMREFEKATEIKRTMFALRHIQDVSLIGKDVVTAGESVRIEAYDVAHLSGEGLVGVMTVVHDGVPAKREYRKFKIKSFVGVNDTKALAEILSRRLGHAEWPLPRLVVVDGGKAQVNAAEKVFKDAGILIPVVGVVKDGHHRPKRFEGSRVLARRYESDILLTNAEAHRFAVGFHRQTLRRR